MKDLAINSIDDVVRLGKVFYESKMFDGVASIAQAIVKVQAGAELGIPPFVSMSGIHIIKGKPTIGAGLMASMVDRHPDYDYQVIKQDDKVCEIKFFKNGKEKGVSKFTKEDAIKAGTQNMQKFPANMLFARAMSNGVKWFCPGVFSGPVYTPEEMETVETTYTEVEEVKEQKEPSLLEKYYEILNNNPHVFTAGDIEKYTLKPETTDATALKAIAKLEALKKEREEILQSEHHEN